MFASQVYHSLATPLGKLAVCKPIYIFITGVILIKFVHTAVASGGLPNISYIGYVQ